MTSDQITTGPAIVKWRSQIYNFVNGLVLQFTTNPFTVETDTYSSERVESVGVTITGVPAGGGRLVAGSAWATPLLYPLSKRPGQKLFLSGADDPLEVIELEQNSGGTWNRYVFHRCAVTTVPNFDIKANALILGPVTWTAMLKRNTDIADANALYTANTLTPLPTDWCLTDAETPTGSPLLYWYDGAMTGMADDPLWHEFSTLDGIRINFAVQTQPISPDPTGPIDLRVTALSATAEFQPIEPASLVRQRHVQQGITGYTRGSLLSTYAVPLTLQSPAICCQIPLAQIVGDRQSYGRLTDTNPVVTARAIKTFLSCVEQPIFQLVAADDVAFEEPLIP